MNIIHNTWPEEAYSSDVYSKDLIVIHHTVSRSARSSEQYLLKRSLFRKEKNNYNIGVAYLIDLNGTIFNTFNEDCWAYHIGAGIKHDKRSIGIELANLGRLRKRDDKFFDIYNQEVKEEEVYKLEYPWRNYSYFHKYSEKQIDSLISLILHLTGKYNIPLTLPENLFPEIPFLQHTNYKGIAFHTHFREAPKNSLDDGGKTDISPAFNDHLNEFLEKTKVELVSDNRTI